MKCERLAYFLPNDPGLEHEVSDFGGPRVRTFQGTAAMTFFAQGIPRIHEFAVVAAKIHAGRETKCVELLEEDSNGAQE